MLDLAIEFLVGGDNGGVVHRAKAGQILDPARNALRRPMCVQRRFVRS